jgi:hypothetical protein
VAELYDEDFEEIKDSIDLLYKRRNIERLDVKLADPNASALVYWAGTVLRVDIKGLR